MVCTRRCLGLLLSAAVLAVPLSAQSGQEPIPNWPAPPFWSAGEMTPAETSDQRPGPPALHAESALSVPTSPLPFIAVNPYRIVDTRKATQPAGYGPPSLAAGNSGSPCRDFRTSQTESGPSPTQRRASRSQGSPRGRRGLLLTLRDRARQVGPTPMQENEPLATTRGRRSSTSR